MQLLLVKGSLLQRDHRGRTPLHCAAANGYTKTMHQLILVHSHLLDQSDRDGVSYIFYHLYVMLTHLHHDQQNTPLHLAVLNNKEGATSLLLSLNCKSEL